MELKINQELTDLLGTIPMFRELEESERAELAVRMELKSYDSGKELFREGDPGGQLLIIFSGSVEVQKSRSHGAGRIVIARFDRGGVLGEMSLIDGMPRSATVVASKPTKIYSLSQEGLEELTQDNPRLAVKFLKGVAMLLSLRLRNTSGWFADVF
jgi:CRP-like cAMP-binding protein